jgi:hypothetical protein
LWRDEAWLWQVVLDSSSVKDLAGALGRTGQGYLFPFLCFFAQGVTASWRALQFVNLGLAASGAFAFARWAPFSRGQHAFGPIGGHNFSWAWATGRLAGRAA